MDKPEGDIGGISLRILAASDSAASLAPITDGLPDFGLHEAYAVAGLIADRRIARGERPVGWKIGFTNETIWDEYGVHAPIWGPMYSSTVAEINPRASEKLSLATLVEPRIEPEIAFRVACSPSTGMDEESLLECIDGVAHGFEIVQSVFPGWRFKAADTVAAFALHGAYRHGPFTALSPADRPDWLKVLASFQVTLFRNGDEIDRGVAANVLGGGPLTALRHFVDALEKYSPRWSVRPGDIITTGTITRAFPIAPGERWSTKLAGLPLPDMSLAFA